MSVDPCPICAGNALTARHSHQAAGVDYQLFGCAGCGLEHWQPLVAPAASYYEDEQQAMYAAMHGDRRRALDDPRFARFLAEFGGCTGRRLLDVGCSDGTLMRAFADAGNEVVGIDIDTNSLDVARARGLDVHRATLDDVGVSLEIGRDLDYVTMFDVLEHLTDPGRALRTAHRLLRPGGHVVGTVPNRGRLFANLVDADFPPHHFLRFDERSLTETLRRCGFVVDRVEVFQWGYAGTVLLNAAIRRAKRVARRGTSAGRADKPAVKAQRSSAGLKRRVAWALNTSAAAALEPVERALGVGFKLYFVARRS